MKKLALLSLLIVSTVINAQIKTEIISETKIQGFIKCAYEKQTNLETNKEHTYFSLGFYNAKYTSLKEVNIISLHVLWNGVIPNDSNEVFSFVKDLKSAYKEMGSNNSIDWNRTNYKLRLTEGLKSLSVYKEDSFTLIFEKAEVKKLIDWIESLGFKK